MLATVIVLKGYTKAEEHLPHLLKSAQKYRWQLTVFEAKNGFTEPFPFKIDHRYPKGAKQFERPGVRGCFLSHYKLWKDCSQTMAIFEHDIIFKKSPPTDLPNADIIKLDGFRPSKPASTGQWWEGAHAYIITPTGAQKLIHWVDTWGASPVDYMLGDKVVNVAFDNERRIGLVDIGSTTWDLKLE